jgi:hypothetical protein
MSDKNLKKKKACSSILKEFDYFGAEMKFRINNDESYKSKLGGGIFFIYFLISLAYVGYNFYQFAWRQVQTLSFSSKVLSPAPSIYLNSTNFTFSLGVVYNDNFTSAVEQTSQYLEYKIYHIGFQGEESMLSQFPTNLCNQSNFQNIPNETFYGNNLNRTICPIVEGNNTNLVIKGDFTDQTQSYLVVIASLRDEVLNNSTKYLEFKKFLNENPIMIQLFMVDTKVDYEEYSDFLGNYLMVINSFPSLNQVKFYEISLSMLTFKTDNNILWQMPDETTSVMFSKSDYNSFSVEDRDKIDIFDKKTLNVFFLKSTSKAFYYERTYQKLTDFLANMTGILSQVILIIFVIMNYINEKAARQKVMRKIMKFKANGNFHADKILTLFKNAGDKSKDESNLNENFQNYNSNKKLLENEHEISGKDIQIELEELPISQKAHHHEVGAPINCRSERSQICEEGKSNYEYPTENLPMKILNNDDLETCQVQSNNNKHENNTQYISPNSPLENIAALKKSPQHKKNFSVNSNLFNKGSTRREILSKEDDNFKLSETPLKRHSSQSNLNVATSKTALPYRNSRLDVTTEVAATNLRKLSVSDNTKDVKVTPSIGKCNLNKKLDSENKKEIKPLKFSYWQIIKNSVHCTKINKKNVLFKMAEKKVKYYMDVLTYIKMMGELDLIKDIIFNESQRHLFDFLAKPLLDNDKKNAKLDKNYYMNINRKAFTIDSKEIEGLYKCYKKVKTQDLKISESNQRLIKMIDEEVEKMKN